MKTKNFDTKVQDLKYRVLKEVARFAWQGTLLDHVMDIPNIIVPGKKPTMRCCIYKEKAIAAERVKLAMGGNPNNPNVIEVIDIACDDCPTGGFHVTDACRGCLAHRCEEACRLNAIYFDENRRAHIDKSKCVECGMCAKSCFYNAIISYKRPCEASCKIKAITMSEDKTAKINNEDCIACGACSYQCPFGAIMDKSYIINVIDFIKNSQNNTKYKVYAIVAPSISSQFRYAKLGQVIAGLKQLGFYSVVEVALGADMVSYLEGQELAQKGFLTSSCCPAFVSYIEKKFPNLKEHISHNLSPMGTIAKYIKETDPTCKIVFIGPCTAKKMEIKRDEDKGLVDVAMTFEELQALIDSKDIDLTKLEEDVLDNASYYGRIFARSGGLSDAVKQAIKEQNIDFEVKPEICNGIEACRLALLKKTKNALDANFIEGMACVGGCIGGAGNITHGITNAAEVDKYGRLALEKTITNAVSVYNLNKKDE